jgi:hypothetical protein
MQAVNVRNVIFRVTVHTCSAITSWQTDNARCQVLHMGVYALHAYAVRVSLTYVRTRVLSCLSIVQVQVLFSRVKLILVQISSLRSSMLRRVEPSLQRPFRPKLRWRDVACKRWHRFSLNYCHVVSGRVIEISSNKSISTILRSRKPIEMHVSL